MTVLGLVEFLTARLDDLETAARETERWMGGAWRVETMPSGPPATAWVRGSEGAEGPVMDRFAEFAALNDPAFVLADIAAKRRIIEELGLTLLRLEWSAMPSVREEGRQVLRLLAQPFSGHRDYRQEWTP